MKRALITGINGFIGSNLAQRLIDDGVEVFGIDIKKDYQNISKSDKYKFFECNLSQINQLNRENLSNIDVIYHLAWHGVKPQQRDNFDLQYQNIQICLNVLRLAKDIGAKKFILLGSTLEYAYNETPIDEYSRPTPVNAYGGAKVASRYLCEQLSNTISQPMIYVVLTSVYGIGREDKNVIYYTIDSLLKNNRPLLTKLEQQADFISIIDAVEALFLIGEKGVSGSFYSVGNGDNLKLSEYIFKIRDLIDSNLPLGIGEKPYISNKLPTSAVNISKLVEDTNFKASMSFESGISELIKFYRERIS